MLLLCVVNKGGLNFLLALTLTFVSLSRPYVKRIHAGLGDYFIYLKAYTFIVGLIFFGINGCGKEENK